MIKIELLNLFISSISVVLKDLSGITMKKERLSSDDLPFTLDDVNVLFGINGSVNSTLVLGMTQPTATKLACLLLAKPVSDPVFAENCVTMIGSDICKSIVTRMNQLGYDVYPRSPSLVSGKHIAVKTLHAKKMVVSVETEIGTISLRITV